MGRGAEPRSLRRGVEGPPGEGAGLCPWAEPAGGGVTARPEVLGGVCSP